MMRTRWVVSGMVAWIVTVAVPSVAAACAVCTAGKDEENAFAFLMTTIFMSIMPLAAIGTLIFVLWRRIQKLDAERAEGATLARDEGATRPPGRDLPSKPGAALPQTSQV